MHVCMYVCMCIYTHTYTHIPSGYLSELENHVVLFLRSIIKKPKAISQLIFHNFTVIYPLQILGLPSCKLTVWMWNRCEKNTICR